MSRAPEDTPIHRGADGVLWARPTVGRRRAPDGSTRYVRKLMRFPGARTEAAARRMLRAELELYGAASGGASGPLLPDVLHRYVRVASVRRLSDSSARAYRGLIDNQVAPILGGVEARRVRGYMIDDLYIELAEKGRLDGGGMSPSSLAKLHGLLAPAFRWMAEMGIVAEDPMRSVARPSVPPVEAFFFDDEHLEVLLPALGELMADTSQRQRAAFRRTCATAAYIALRCGLRCGEALALLPAHVSERAMEMRVCGTVAPGRGGLRRKARTKGGRSRTLAVGADVTAATAAHLEWAAGLPLPRRRSTGLLCVPAGPRAGGWMWPSSVERWFKGLCAALGLPSEAVFHSLRHTCAAILLSQGIDFRELQERLGHATAAVTLSLYGHTSPARDRRAAAAVARYLDDLGG